MSEMIVIYVDGVQVLAPLESIYVPIFEKEIAVRQVEGGNQSNGKKIVT